MTVEGKVRETMSSRERVVKALRHEEADRVPIDTRHVVGADLVDLHAKFVHHTQAVCCQRHGELGSLFVRQSLAVLPCFQRGRTFVPPGTADRIG